jgi:N-methylhydantoinase A/oxoprolinase/acetone carboxylase beta subunit
VEATPNVTDPAAAATAERVADASKDGARRSYTLSIDTGGTFTDGFVTDGVRSAQVKVDTTPHDLTVGFQSCVEAAASAVGEGLATFLSSLDTLHFSSTIATNTIVERRGARVGLIVSAGAEGDLYGSADQAQALAAFVDLDVVRGIPERVDDAGLVVTEPTGGDLEVAVRELLERGVRLIVVSFANAHLNPANELRARALIDASYPRHYLGAVPLMIASRISLAPDDHGRTAVAVVNAYLHPILARTLYRAEDQARDSGMKRPLLIVNTDGSSSRVAKSRAIDTYNSGPSAGVLGSAYVAAALGAEHVCTFDVGGTTTDVAYLAGAKVGREPATEVGPAVVPHPAVSLWSFGLGGGSIVSVDPAGAIAVGPESAGSSPGPACFDLGGTELTPTDVWLLLGYLEPGAFLGGRRRLDRARAHEVATTFAEALGSEVETAVLRAKEAIRAALRRELDTWAARRAGFAASDPSQRWLFSYGGGGGLLCFEAAEALSCRRVVVFPHSSVFSAFGGGLLPIAHAYEAVIAVDASAHDATATVAKLADQARRDLRAEGIVDLAHVETLLSIGGDAPAQSTLRALVDEPQAAGMEAPSAPVRVRLEVSVPRETKLEVLVGDERTAAGTRQVVTADGPVDVPMMAGLGRPDAPDVGGPVFLDAADTTIFVPAGWSATFTEQGFGVLTKEEGAPA